MELKEFIRKFAGCQMHKVNVGNTVFDLYGKFFPEALRNFADAICEKQRWNCEEAASVVNPYSGHKALNAPQPKIEEL